MTTKGSKRGITLFAVAVAAAAVLAPTAALAHCQIPCGIYDDEMRFRMLEEHITTIEKSMNEINSLSEDPSANANQLARWVMNKENHADAMAEIVTEYFLRQRIKPGEVETDHMGWMGKVTACHNILVSSMKAKQTTDLQHVADLREHVAAFRKAYFSEDEARQLEENPWHSHLGDSKDAAE